MRTAAVLLILTGATLAQGELPVLDAITASYESFQREFDYGSTRYGEPWITGCSSSLPASGSDYSADNLLDGDLTTAWVEGVCGHGRGEYFSIQAPLFTDYLDPETIAEDGIDMIGYPVSMIVVYNGYQKSPELYQTNGRVRTLMLWLNGERLCFVELEDTPEPQMIEVMDLFLYNIPGYEGISLNDGDTVRLEILEVYPGTKYEDTAVSEILILGGQG